MDVKSCAKLAVLMLVATVALQASAAEVQSAKSIFCKANCVTSCGVLPKSDACYLTCYKNCMGASEEAETPESQCNLDCLLSKCADRRPDAKKIEGCVNSCSENCKKS